MLSKQIKQLFYKPNQLHLYIGRSPCSTGAREENVSLHEFHPLELYPKYTIYKKEARTIKKLESPIPPRSTVMTPDQNWGDVWPTARSFHPGTVPLPVRMGYPAPNSPVPDKWGNAELMKIPNFLHLTPPVVARQCAAIRKFCTPWPEGVSYPVNITKYLGKETEEEALKRKKRQKSKFYVREASTTNDGESLPEPGSPGYFPMLRTKSSYLYSGPSIRDPRSRVVTLKFQIEDLNLTAHGRDKLMRMLDDRYEPKTNTITITVDRCPLYCQNLDYAEYVITVLRAEAEKVEPWEHEKTRADFSEFLYEGSESEAAVCAWKKIRNEEGGKDLTEEKVEAYKAALDKMLNVVDSDESIADYSKSVLDMLGIKEVKHDQKRTHNYTLNEDYDSSLPNINIQHLPSWEYQEKKRVIMISHAWPKVKEWW